MVESKDLQSGKQRIAMSLKVAIAVAVLSLVALTVEQPRLSAAPVGQAASTDEMSYFADLGSPDDLTATAMTSPSIATSTPKPILAPESVSTYFPAQFPAPRGDEESQPATF